MKDKQEFQDLWRRNVAESLAGAYAGRGQSGGLRRSFPPIREDQAMVASPDGWITAPDDIFAAQLKQSSNVILAVADANVMPLLKFRTNAWRVHRRTDERRGFRGWRRFSSSRHGW